MPNTPTLKITLILVCVAVHIFNASGLSYSHPSISKNLFVFNNEWEKLLEVSNKVPFLSRILGGYFLGKIADRYGFIKTMKIICLAYFLASILIAFFDKLDFLQGSILLCFVHSIHSFFRLGSFIIPAIYIFRHCKVSEVYKYSSFVWVVAIAGLAITNLYVVIFINAQHIDWCVVYIATSAISLFIYNYIATLPELREDKVPKTIPCQATFLAFLFAGICGAGLTYQFYVVETYINDVLILETAGQYVIYSPFWITLFLMFIPASQIIKNLGAINTIFISLLGILFSVNLLYISPL